jgi:RNA ligase (TIGR02306 family)
MGEASFGLAVEIPEGCPSELGANVADFFGATKWEPPVRLGCGQAERDHVLFEKYTSIENMRNFRDIFKDGEPVIATEKCHGTNARVAVIAGEEMAGSHTTRRRKPIEGEESLYWFPWKLEPVRNLLRELAKECEQVILYGEIYGGSVQGANFSYGVAKGKGYGFRAFDLLVKGRYLDYDDFKAICDRHAVETMPLLYRGPFSLAKCRELSSGKTKIGDTDQMREGVVVRPEKERTDPRVGRVVLKYVSDDFLLRGKAVDFAEV